MTSGKLKPGTAGLLESHWPQVVELAPDYADQLQQQATLLPAGDQRCLRSVVQWFRGEVALSDALPRPGVICFCDSLCQRLAAGSSDVRNPENVLRGAAQAGIQRFFQQTPRLAGSSMLLRYTFAILLGVMFVFCLISFVVLPQFETMYREFGIELPRATTLFFQLGNLVRRGGWLLIPLAGSLWLVFEIYQSMQGRGSQALRIGFLQTVISGKRSLGARLAFHLSKLLSLGVDRQQALATVGGGSGERSSGEFLKSRFPLVYEGLSDDLLGRAMATLDASGNYLRTTGDKKREWALRLLNVGLLTVTLGMVFLVILSLFSPLIAIVSGLTGGGPF